MAEASSVPQLEWTISDVRWSGSPECDDNLLTLLQYKCSVCSLNAFSLCKDLGEEKCRKLALVIISCPCPPTEWKNIFDCQVGTKTPETRRAIYTTIIMEAIAAQCPNAMVVLLLRCMEPFTMRVPQRQVVSVKLANLPDGWVPKACNHAPEDPPHELKGGHDLWCLVAQGGTQTMQQHIFSARHELSLLTLLQIANQQGMGSQIVFLGEWDASLSLCLAKAIEHSPCEPHLCTYECMPSRGLDARSWGTRQEEYTYVQYLTHVGEKCPSDPPEIQALKAAIMWYKACLSKSPSGKDRSRSSNFMEVLLSEGATASEDAKAGHHGAVPTFTMEEQTASSSTQPEPGPAAEQEEKKKRQDTLTQIMGVLILFA